MFLFNSSRKNPSCFSAHNLLPTSRVMILYLRLRFKRTRVQKIRGYEPVVLESPGEHDGVLLDYSRQRASLITLEKLLKLAEVAHLTDKINMMYSGEHINSTKDRPVLHIALHAAKDSVIHADGRNVVPDAWNVLEKISDFAERIRNDSWVGETGKPLKDVVSVGIGGSFLGPLFVHTALQTDPEAAESAKDRQLRFLANVDPVNVARSITRLNPEKTLVGVVSKTFTTAETMLNAWAPRE